MSVSFFRRLRLNDTQQKCLKSEYEVPPAPRNTMVQLSPPYTDPKLHNTLRHSQRDGQTDDSIMPTADHTACRSTFG